MGSIAKHYIRHGSFVFDIFSIIALPIYYMIDGSIDEDSERLIFFLRFCRLSKLFVLMNLQSITVILRKTCRRRLSDQIHN